MSFLSMLLEDADREIRLSAIREEIRRQEGPPVGRAHWITDYDMEHTRYRILNGKPMLPMAGWRW